MVLAFVYIVRAIMVPLNRLKLSDFMVILKGHSIGQAHAEPIWNFEPTDGTMSEMGFLLKILSIAPEYGKSDWWWQVMSMSLHLFMGITCIRLCSTLDPHYSHNKIKTMQYSCFKSLSETSLGCANMCFDGPALQALQLVIICRTESCH